MMFVFLSFDLALVGGWSSMFVSTTFKLTFLQWRFFSVMSVVAIVLVLSCLAFGVICRINFGNDLKRHRKYSWLPYSHFHNALDCQ